MKLAAIIQTPLETDAYKFSMGQCIFHQFNNYTTKWAFRCRNPNVQFTEDMVKEIREQIDNYCGLSFSNEELQWLEINLPWIHRDYLDYLRLWRPRREEITVSTSNDYNNCGLSIEAEGTWLNTSMYEIAILAIVNEVYFAFTYGRGAKDQEFIDRTIEHVISASKSGISPVFSEFGLRRRLSRRMHDWLINFLVNNSDVKGSHHFSYDFTRKFVGTSNVYLARKYDIKAVGTQAHEFIMCVGQGNHKHNPAYSNWYAMDAWIKQYSVLNGLVLCDTLTTDLFLKDFNLTYATLFSGVRHDSGDPFDWGDKIIQHYHRLGIDPCTKTLLFSDSLDFDKVIAIQKYFTNRCKVAFGIGTFLSNPLDNPLNIVMKVTECNGMPVAKLSDVEGKGMCKDPEYVEYLKRSISWRMRHEEV